MIDSRHEVYDQLIQSYLRLSQVFIGCQQTLIIHWIEILAYFSQGYIKLFLWIDREEETIIIIIIIIRGVSMLRYLFIFLKRKS